MYTQVTVITASTGRESIINCIESVAKQTGPSVAKIQHLIFADGPESSKKLFQHIPYDMISGRDKYSLYKDVELIELPFSVGQDRWNGHRMYAAGTYLADGEYVMFLDDDNTIDEYHINDCLEAIHKNQTGWAYSLRKIVDKNGVILCNDDCESLGPDYPTVINANDRLVDVNCYFIQKKLAVYVSPIWHRKAREPGVPEVDRALVHVLNQATKGVGTGKYTVNYTVDSTNLSVSGEFFARGNEIMQQRYPNGFPWRK
jgi:hypothetical protein